MISCEIKAEIIKAGLKQYEVARYFGCSEIVFSKKLRNGLTEEETKKVIEIIKNLKGGAKDGKN